MRRVIAIVLLEVLLPAIAVGASVSIFADHTDDEIMTTYTELTAELQRRGLLATSLAKNATEKRRPRNEENQNAVAFNPAHSFPLFGCRRRSSRM